MDDRRHEPIPGERISRRRFLAASGAVAGAAGIVGAGFGLGPEPTASASAARGSEPFYGPHQAGIATAQQDRLFFAAFDLTTTKVADVVALMAQWTDAAARLTDGLDVAPETTSEAAPPTDTGEAMGLDPAHLTLTFGFGPTLFEKDGVDRYGLARRRPEALADLPAFARDNLDPAHSGGDLCVQACSNDPQVNYHAIRNLARLARGTAVLRWTQQGFGRTSSTTAAQATPRNLMGFKDGTNNLRTDLPGFDDKVWVPEADGPAWMVGGSYLVVRRIRMHIEVWDRSTLLDQENTIGRTKVEGAPLGGRREHDPIDLGAERGGEPVIPVDAHIRLANQDANAAHILRRGYSFTDGIKPATGQLDAGLFFLAYQRDPRTQFVPLQRRLATD
ncbi:MAG TPA: iron uptake transporter deferrochelatase/peroxidase subunit, partial [Acidimicrobiia bacterium]|nr:iron uptake transporter deferrochelatase/peroxidase subunit [Acidimicrobiia bacterium]